MHEFLIRPAQPGDEAGAYYVCLKTGDHGQDGEPFYRDDPDALGRIFVGPYLAFEPELSLSSKTTRASAAMRSARSIRAPSTRATRPSGGRELCARFPAPQGDPSQWTRVSRFIRRITIPDYFCPEPYDAYPSHLHIDLLPRAQGRGYGRRMLEQMMDMLRRRGSPGAHLGVSVLNTRASGSTSIWVSRIDPHRLRTSDGCIYMGKTL